MSGDSNNDLKIKEKHELSGNVEHTRAGIVFTPDVDIFETDQSLTVLADMPGVTPESLTVDLRDDTLTITGGAVQTMAEGERTLITEYETGTYFRQFSLSEVIDQQGIDAQLKNGVLRLTLPKVQKASPRKIAVRSE